MAIARIRSIALSSLFLLSACAGTTTPGPGTAGEGTPGEGTPASSVMPAAKPKDAPSEKAEGADKKDEVPADKPVEDAPPPPAAPISCEPKAGASSGAQGPKLALEVDRSKVDLDGRKLEVKLNRPACKVAIKVFGESGKMLAEIEKGFDGAAAGTPLAIAWTASGTETIKRVEIWGHDTDGSFVGVAITPWNVKIDHEEVNFENDSDAIRASEVPKLEASLTKVREVLSAHKDIGNVQLYIAGHTDTVGSPEHNLALSRRRARAIAGWFRSHGLKIPVSYEGFGEHSLLVKTADETAEAKNRRVDYILSLEPPRLPQGSVSFAWKGSN
jgi:outer membrane protein OmpA-like peptidoglycan-associated protein